MYDTTDPATDPGAVAAGIHRLRERVRADRRTVTAPLVVFGTLILGRAIVASAVAASAGPAGRHLALLLYWPVAGAIGLFVLWNHAHRLAVREGVGEGPRSYRPVTLGYVVSLPLLAVLFIPAFLLGVWAPLVWPAAIIAAVGFRQHSRALTAMARGLGLAGVVQGLLALIQQTGSGSAGLAWVALGLEAAVGIGMVVSAFVMARRIRQA